MDVLNFIAWLAVIILSLELLLLTFVIAILCAGIWFGLRYVDKKTPLLITKLNGWIAIGQGYERKALRMAVKPVILIYAAGEALGASVSAVIDKAGKAP